MNGMERTIDENINIFNYRYYSYDENLDNYIYENSGNEKLIMLKNDYEENYLILKYFTNVNKYKNKIDQYIINDSDEPGLIISDYISDKFQVSVGDSIYVYSPSDIKLTTQNIPFLKLPISTIFEMESDIYNDRYIVSSVDIIKDNFTLNKPLMYFYDYKSNINLISKEDDDFLLAALSLEKKIYTSLGYLVILISCLMMFNVMVMVIIDKNKQIDVIKIIGLSKKEMYKIIIVKNITISLTLSIIALFFAEIIIYFNYYYNYFPAIFQNLPFKITPISNSLYNYLILLGLINLLSIISSILPYMFKNKIMELNA